MRALIAGAFGALVAAAALTVACAPRGGSGGPGTPTPVVDGPIPAPATASIPAPATAPIPAPIPAPIAGEAHGRWQGRDRIARIALAGKVQQAPVSATGRWRIDEQGGRTKLVTGRGAESWRVEQRGRLMRVVGDRGSVTPWREGPFVARASDDASTLRYANRRYRGELWFTPTDSGILVVNRVPVEDYLRGVVPIELGTRQPGDRAALEAQAIAARSYAYIRVPADASVEPRRGWHMVATVQNQVYGGYDIEAPIVNEAIDHTAGLVLRFNGLLVDAPYSSSCGGRTAAPRESWRAAREEPYLQSVDDTDPRTGRPYCDISSRNHWTAEFDEGQLHETVRRALVAAGARDPRPGVVTEMRVAGRTASGRATALVLRTDRGEVTVRHNEIRNVLRDTRGAILSSTYFSVDRASRARGHLSGVSLRGHGNGHGVGMCQWGAIGRSRAGIDARTILRHYYPGTVVGFAD
jgi:stage II sporulation protein D